MQINIVTKGLDDKDKKEFTEYLNKKLPRLEKLTTHFAEDAVLLVATIEHFEKHDAYKTNLRLQVPSHALIAEESTHAITKGLDDTIDRLIAQLKDHIDKLRDR